MVIFYWPSKASPKTESSTGTWLSWPLMAQTQTQGVNGNWEFSNLLKMASGTHWKDAEGEGQPRCRDAHYTNSVSYPVCAQTPCLVERSHDIEAQGQRDSHIESMDPSSLAKSAGESAFCPIVLASRSS